MPQLKGSQTGGISSVLEKNQAFGYSQAFD
jgi:hypothetical protein